MKPGENGSYGYTDIPIILGMLLGAAAGYALASPFIGISKAICYFKRSKPA